MMGLIIGTVIENYNAEHPGMVQVSYPLDAKENAKAWMPVVSGYAGKNYGLYLLPEKGEQVIVGFIDGDPPRGVVLGSLWNDTNTIPPNTASKNNLIKRFVTKSGHSVTFNDGENGYVAVKSKSGHTIEIDDGAKTVKVATGDGKQVLTLDADKGATSLVSGGKLELNADTIVINGKTTIKGQTVTLEADHDLTMKGKQIKIESSTTAKISSNAAELTGVNVKINSSGILTLKGSMTKIN